MESVQPLLGRVVRARTTLEQKAGQLEPVSQEGVHQCGAAVGIPGRRTSSSIHLVIRSSFDEAYCKFAFQVVSFDAAPVSKEGNYLFET